MRAGRSDDWAVLLDEEPASKRVRTIADLELDPHSGIRIKTDRRKLSRDDVNALASTFAVKRLDELQRLLRSPTPTLPSSWLTIGVLTSKGDAKPTKRGDSSFCVWKLCDLKNPMATATTVSVFLFGEAFSSSWKELTGTVFALLNAKPLPKREDGAGGGKNDEGAVSIEKAQQLVRIGESAEFGVCKAERSDGRPCTDAVNKNECEYCEYHAAAKLREMQKNLSKQQKQPAQQQPAQQQQLRQGQGAMGAMANGMAMMPPSQHGSMLHGRPTWPQAATQSYPSAPGVSIEQQVDAIWANPMLKEAVIARYRREAKATTAAFEAPDPNDEHAIRRMQQRQLAAGAELKSAARANVASSSTASFAATTSRSGDSSGGGRTGGGSGGGGTSHAASSKQVAGGAAAEKSRFEQAFGPSINLDSKEGKRLLEQKPVMAAREKDAHQKALNASLDHLEKKDALEQKVASLKVMEVSVFHCKDCKYGPVERLLPECRSGNHNWTTCKMKKKGFRCGKCNTHTTVINKKMPSVCEKCGSTDNWKEASLKREKHVALPSEEFLPRGEEHGKFRNSAPAPKHVEHVEHQNGVRAPLGSRSVGSSSNNHNLFSSTMPEAD